MTTHPYTKELQVGSLAVQRAAVLTKKLLSQVDKGHFDKSDDTPVTIADFAAQASIIAAIHNAFPNDSIIGEEDSTALRENEPLFERTWELATSTHLEDPESELHLHTPATRDEMLSLIDLGAKPHTTPGTGRVWTLDPVDGTATFMTGQQYAVCLSLIQDGVQVLGILGCPNLPDSKEVHEDNVDKHGHGNLLTVVAGHGARIQPLGKGALLPSRKIPRVEQITSGSDLRFVDTGSTPASSGRLDIHAAVASHLGARWPHTVDLWSAQMRYVAIAMGACNAFVKVPKSEKYRSKIWDHSGGMLLAQELGCLVTDLQGQAVDCGRGRTLEGCYGMVVAPASVHGKIVEAVKSVRGG